MRRRVKLGATSTCNAKRMRQGSGKAHAAGRAQLCSRNYAPAYLEAAVELLLDLVSHLHRQVGLKLRRRDLPVAILLTARGGARGAARGQGVVRAERAAMWELNRSSNLPVRMRISS